ncbi:MAG: TetR/AcrR family transcriptional regulator [Ferruginibacter sp.]
MIQPNHDSTLRIRDAAHALFMQYGLKSVSMDDISTRLGMSKKTLYKHFSDKESLVEAVVLAIVQQNEARCVADKKKSANAIHEIFLAMAMMAELFRHMNPSILFDLMKYYPKAYRVFYQHKNQWLLQVYTDNFQRGIQEGLYRPDIRIDIMARFRVESVLIPFQPEFQQSVKTSLTEAAAELSLHFLYGIVTPKGYKMVDKYIEQKK